MEITDADVEKINALSQDFYKLMKAENNGENPPLGDINNVGKHLLEQMINVQRSEIAAYLTDTHVSNIKGRKLSHELYGLMKNANSGKNPSPTDVRTVVKYVHDLMINQYYAELTVNLMGAAEPGDVLNIKRGPVTYRTQG